MDYIGEHLMPGRIGHFFTVLSLVSSLIATFAYFKASSENKTAGSLSSGTGVLLSAWQKLARYAFITECISVFIIFGTLVYILTHHYFEYKYAWQHSSTSLEFKYLLAGLWEGQEGSFLLWSVWHCVLGLFVIKNNKVWEAPAMTVISFAQFCLATMLAGFYIFGVKVGANPFVLLRESGIFDNAPGMHVDFNPANPVRPDYLGLEQIKSGNDLNPLLQNKWMVIHPPVLFLGFASTIIPFAIAVAGLWKKQLSTWIKDALPWTLFGAAVLGVGIMMGGWWAYESLTFGGYWAWDPVENASLVPWMILIAGLHTLLIYKHSGYSLRATYIFLILSFLFVLYSTFLTRTGVLQETSVHAFTGEGNAFKVHILLFLLVFVLPSLILFAARYKSIPALQREEKGSSREFWMFIGSLVFFLSAIVIIGKTSLPVFNIIFGTKVAPPEDPEFAYNSIQVYVAVIVGLLTAITQYFKYRETPSSYFWKKILIPTIIAVAAATLVLVFGNVNYIKKGPVFQASIWMATAASIYAIVANIGYIWLGIKGKLKLSGGSIAHAGFGMVLLGILLSSAKKEVLSNNIGGIPAPLAPGEDPRENLTLVKGLTVDMGKYSLTYESDSMHPKKQLWFYKVRFKSKDGREDFVLQPNAFVNYKGNEGLMANPASKHYWDHDVFTYITSLPNPDREKDTASFRSLTARPGDSLFYSAGYIVVQSIETKDSLPEDIFGKNGMLYEAPLKVHAKTGSVYSLVSRLALAKGEPLALPDTIIAESLIVRLQKVNADKSFELGIKESSGPMKFVTLKAYKFPFIYLVWLGVGITALGIFISMAHRIRSKRRASES